MSFASDRQRARSRRLEQHVTLFALKQDKYGEFLLNTIPAEETKG